MPSYNLRILLETVEGKKTSYFTRGASYTNFIATGTEGVVMSASTAYDRITGSISCSFQNEPKFTGTNDTSKLFGQNTLLSASLTGSADTGSIVFTAMDTDYDRLLRYKFIGEKVTNTLGLPNDQWIYVDQVRLPADDEANIFQGNANLGNTVITDTLTFAGGSDVNSDIPLLIDTGSDRYVKFVDERGIAEVALRMGYDVDSDVYEISGSDDFTFNMGGVDNAILTSITSSNLHIIRNTDGGNTSIKVTNSNTDTGTDKGAGIEFRHMDNTGAIRPAGAIIAGKDSGYNASVGGDDAIDSNLKISTVNNGVGGERIRITSDGKVGIGTSEPTEVLQVEGDISASGDIIGNRYIVNSTVSNITQSFSSGSTIFGDTIDDTHKFTGSLDISGSIANIETGKITASGHIVSLDEFLLRDGDLSGDRLVRLYADSDDGVIDIHANDSAVRTHLHGNDHSYFIGSVSFGTTAYTGEAITIQGGLSASGDIGISSSVINTAGVSGSGTISGFTSASIASGSFDGISIGNASPPPGHPLVVEGNISSSGQLIAASADFNDGNITNVGDISVDKVKGDAAGNVAIELGASGIVFNAEAGDSYFFNTDFANVDLQYQDENEDIIFNIDQSIPAVGIGALGGVPTATLDVAGNIKGTNITASGNISASGTIIASKFESAGGSGELINFNDNLSVVGDITSSGNISASGNLDITGKANIDGDIDISGSVITTAGISGSGTISIASGSFDGISIGNATPPAGNPLVVEGNISQSSTSTASLGEINLGDDTRIKLGTGNDLQIYHKTAVGGDHSIIQDSGTGNLILLTNLLQVKNAANDEVMIQSNQGGAVKLNHNNSTKFETTTTGITVTGDIDISSSAINTAGISGSGTISGFTSASIASGSFDGISIGNPSPPLGQELVVEGNISASGIITAEGLTITDDFDLTDDLTVGGNVSGSMTSTGSFGMGLFSNKIGIGLSNPSTPLHLSSGGTSTGSLRFINSHDVVNMNFVDNSDNSGFQITYVGTGGAEIELQADGDLLLNASNGDNVGIGTDSPATKLDVKGDISASGDIQISSSVINTAGISGSGTISGFTSASIASGSFDGISIGNTSPPPGQELVVEGNTSASGTGSFSDGRFSNKVGIGGATAPTTELEVWSANEQAYHYPFIVRNPYNSNTPNINYGVGMRFHLDDASEAKFGAISYEANTAYGNNGALRFFVDGNGLTTSPSSSQAQFSINSSGDITASGDISASGNLDITGRANIDGDIDISGSVITTAGISGSGTVSGFTSASIASGSFDGISIGNASPPLAYPLVVEGNISASGDSHRFGDLSTNGATIEVRGDSSGADLTKLGKINLYGQNDQRLHLRSMGDGGFSATQTSKAALVASQYDLGIAYNWNEGGTSGQASELRIYNSESIAITVTSQSRVGIGTGATVGEALEVVGNISASITSTGSFGSVVVSDRVQGNLTVDGTLFATKKSFLINKPKGGKLEYGVLEGPQHDVFFRGELKGDNVIYLPKEWDWLVDENTITTQLTSIGKHQDLFVKEIKDNKIFIDINGVFKTKQDIHCYHIVHGTRKDVERIENLE